MENTDLNSTTLKVEHDSAVVFCYTTYIKTSEHDRREATAFVREITRTWSQR